MLYSVDRMEREIAVLVDEDGNSVDVPLSALPTGVRGGDMVRLCDGVYTRDDDAAAARRQKIWDLQNRLRKKK